MPGSINEVARAVVPTGAGLWKRKPAQIVLHVVSRTPQDSDAYIAAQWLRRGHTTNAHAAALARDGAGNLTRLQLQASFPGAAAADSKATARATALLHKHWKTMKIERLDDSLRFLVFGEHERVVFADGRKGEALQYAQRVSPAIERALPGYTDGFFAAMKPGSVGTVQVTTRDGTVIPGIVTTISCGEVMLRGLGTYHVSGERGAGYASDLGRLHLIDASSIERHDGKATAWGTNVTLRNALDGVDALDFLGDPTHRRVDLHITSESSHLAHSSLAVSRSGWFPLTGHADGMRGALIPFGDATNRVDALKTRAAAMHDAGEWKAPAVALPESHPASVAATKRATPTPSNKTVPTRTSVPAGGARGATQAALRTRAALAPTVPKPSASELQRAAVRAMTVPGPAGVPGLVDRLAQRARFLDTDRLARVTKPMHIDAARMLGHDLVELELGNGRRLPVEASVPLGDAAGYADLELAQQAARRGIDAGEANGAIIVETRDAAHGVRFLPLGTEHTLAGDGTTGRRGVVRAVHGVAYDRVLDAPHTPVVATVDIAGVSTRVSDVPVDRTTAPDAPFTRAELRAVVDAAAPVPA